MNVAALDRATVHTGAEAARMNGRPARYGGGAPPP